MLRPKVYALFAKYLLNLVYKVCNSCWSVLYFIICYLCQIVTRVLPSIESIVFHTDNLIILHCVKLVVIYEL